MEYTEKEISKILSTGIALSKEKDRNILLDKILDESMDITSCDAGTLYIYKNNKLYFKVMKTISLGIDKGKRGEKIDLPPVELAPDNVCSYTAINKAPLNIINVYDGFEQDGIKFNFLGPRNYDKLTGYHTQSMLTIPLLDQYENTVGVLQLINALDKSGKIIGFDKKYESIIMSLACQAAIAVTNIVYMNEIKEQMWSFTEAMAETIDARTPYNANHVRNVALYAEKMADYINRLHKDGKEDESFSSNRKEQLVLGALMHDMGKAVIPTKVMNKATRLGDKLPGILQRLELISSKYRIMYLENKIPKELYEEKSSRISYISESVVELDKTGFLTDEKMAQALDIASEKFDGENIFSDDEIECMLIKKGTLTDGEREQMESHVEITERILKKVHFNSQYKNAMTWAIQHHECLDGSGYPRHLKAEDLALESRILAVCDICDALLATDRPYKKPMPKEKAFFIMHDMASSGKLDEKLVSYLEECI